jgi:hypothetical protein
MKLKGLFSIGEKMCNNLVTAALVSTVNMYEGGFTSSLKYLLVQLTMEFNRQLLTQMQSKTMNNGVKHLKGIVSKHFTTV